MDPAITSLQTFPVMGLSKHRVSVSYKIDGFFLTS